MWGGKGLAMVSHCRMAFPSTNTSPWLHSSQLDKILHYTKYVCTFLCPSVCQLFVLPWIQKKEREKNVPKCKQNH